MHIRPIADAIPTLSGCCVPPLVLGTAALAHRAYADHGLRDLLAYIERPAHPPAERAALTLDRAQAHALRFRPRESATLQHEALTHGQQFRVADVLGTRSARPLRLLALVAPGNLMANTPLDFITVHCDVRLDLLYVVPGAPLPSVVPDHDVAFFAVSESEGATLRRLAPLFAAWPRPALNDPLAVGRLARDTAATALRSVAGVYAPATLRVSRDQLIGGPPIALLESPVLIRPVGSHAGQGLALLKTRAELEAYLAGTTAQSFFLTAFVDYADAGGFYRKLRVAMIDGAPFLCHMAMSRHWMVHYLNAEMAGHADRRDEEAAAMAQFDTGFARRHAAALGRLNEWTGLDYYQMDCAEAPDGRLLLFELDVAAIVHAMDPPDLFPYKAPQMQRVFRAFEAMLRRRAGLGRRAMAPQPPLPVS